MNIIPKFKTLPVELIQYIFSFDRVMSIRKISKLDYRYKLLLTTIPNKRTTYYNNNEIRGWVVKFSNQRYLLSMTLNENLENMVVWINKVDDDSCGFYLWK